MQLQGHIMDHQFAHSYISPYRLSVLEIMLYDVFSLVFALLLLNNIISHTIIILLYIIIATHPIMVAVRAGRKMLVQRTTVVAAMTTGRMCVRVTNGLYHKCIYIYRYKALIFISEYKRDSKLMTPLVDRHKSTRLIIRKRRW